MTALAARVTLALGAMISAAALSAPPEPAEPVETLSPVVEASTPEVELDATRPAWVGQSQAQLDSHQRAELVSDPFSTRKEGEDSLDPAFRRLAASYLAEFLGPDAARFVSLDLDKLRRRATKEVFVEPLETSVGSMRRVHLLVEFDKSLRAELEADYAAGVQRHRVRQAGGVAAVVLGVVGVAFGYFRLTLKRDS